MKKIRDEFELNQEGVRRQIGEFWELRKTERGGKKKKTKTVVLGVFINIIGVWVREREMRNWRNGGNQTKPCKQSKLGKKGREESFTFKSFFLFFFRKKKEQDKLEEK